MWKWFFSSNEPTEEDCLKTLEYLAYISSGDFCIETIASAKEKFPNIHKSLFTKVAYVPSTVTAMTLLKNMMVEWPDDLIPSMKDVLTRDIPSVNASMAMGSEKSKFNTSFYTKVRDALSLRSSEFRALLKSIKENLNDLHTVNVDVTQEYCLCLFNEPINIHISNISCNKDIPILSMYKGEIEEHEYMYEPTNSPLETPLTMDDVNILRKKTDKPLVIITSHVDEGVIPPENVFVVFTETTKSWGSQVIPFFNEGSYSALKNAIDFFNVTK